MGMTNPFNEKVRAAQPTIHSEGGKEIYSFSEFCTD